MTKPKFLTPNFIENAVRFVIYFLVVALTPLAAAPLAPLFDWVAYSSMRAVFVEAFTIIFWGIEALLFHFIEKWAKSRKRKAAPLPPLSVVEEDGQLVVSLAEPIEGVNGEGKPVEEDAKGEKKKKKKQKREPSPPLPLKNLAILTAICVVCIFTVSAIIGFQVKPLYEIRGRFTDSLAVIVRNAFKCMWIVGMVKASQNMAREILKSVGREGDKPYSSWLIAWAILMLFGFFDIFTSVLSYPLRWRGALTGITYVFFYFAFLVVYHFTKEHKKKTYFLTLLIYLF